MDFESESDVLVDGGVRNISPLSSAFRARTPQEQAADEIYVLLTSRSLLHGDDLPKTTVFEDDYDRDWKDNLFGTKVKGIDVLARSVEILTDEVYLDDIRGALHWNAVAEKVGQLHQASQDHPPPAEVAAAIRALGESLDDVEKRAVKLHVIAPSKWYGPDENRNSSTEFRPQWIRDAIQEGIDIAQDPSRWIWPR